MFFIINNEREKNVDFHSFETFYWGKYVLASKVSFLCKSFEMFIIPFLCCKKSTTGLIRSFQCAIKKKLSSAINKLQPT